MSGGRELPPGGLQPRSDEDARRYPARSERCLEVRGMLRDHADGDLPARLKAQVEDHVHRCRDCGLALSRAELEVLRLREAFQGPDPRRLAPSEEFTAAVMARARAELQRGEPAGQGRQPTEGFTVRVMRGVKRQVEREARRREEDRRGWQRRRALLAAAVLLLLAALAVNMPGGPGTDVRVVDAADAWLVTAAGPPEANPLATGPLATDPLEADPREAEPLEAGELPAGARVRTGGSGLVELWVPGLGGQGAGSQVYLEADSELSLGDGHVLTLGHGRLTAASVGSLEVHLADGSKVVLKGGASRLEALEYHAFDRELARGPDLRVRLVVHRGRAEIWRGGEGTEVIEGRVAYFSTRQPVRLDQAVGEDLLQASAENARELAQRLAAAGSQQPAVEEAWLGRLLHPVTRQPVGGAVVRLQTHLGTKALTTDAQGRFRAPDLPQLLDQFAVASARASGPGIGSLGHGPRVLELDRVAAGEGPVELVMARHRRLSGRLLGPANRPVPGLWLLPVLVDEALGLVQPLPDLAAGLEPDGTFGIGGLPATLPPQMSLVLVALCGDRAPEVCFTSQGADGGLGDAGLRLSVGGRDPVQLAGLPRGQELEILQTVPGLPPGRLLARRLVNTGALGEAELPHGAGTRLWLLRSDGPPQALLPRPDGRLVPEDGIQAPATLADLRAANGLHGQGVQELYVTGAGQTRRFARVAEVPAQGLAGGAGQITVHRNGAPAQARSALVFLRTERTEGGSETVFLGLHARGPLPFVVPAAGYVLLAVEEDGLGHLRVPAGAGPLPQLSIPVQTTRSLSIGSLGLPAELVRQAREAGGILHLRWRGSGQGAAWPVYLTRQLPLGVTGGELRGLLPGSYEIRFPDDTTVTRVVP